VAFRPASARHDAGFRPRPLHRPRAGRAPGALRTHSLNLGLALRTGFRRPWAYPLAAFGAAAMWLLLAWSGDLIQDYPSGWEFHAAPQQFWALVLLAVLFGLLLPLEAAALSRARSVAGLAGASSGVVFGLLSMSCCAPLIIPAILSFVGFSGTAILGFNTAISAYETPLTLAAIALMLLSLGLVSRTLTTACKLPASR